MPTRLGNLLRAAEEFPWSAYSLEITYTWHHLWLVLPQEVREEVSTARQGLVERAQFMLYGCIYALLSLGMALFGIGVWWAPLLGLFVALISYYIGMLPTAESYGRLIRAAYAVHRFTLYEALHWTLPTNDVEELTSGEQLTLYLTSGLAPQNFEFKHRNSG